LVLSKHMQTPIETLPKKKKRVTPPLPSPNTNTIRWAGICSHPCLYFVLQHYPPITSPYSFFFSLEFLILSLSLCLSTPAGVIFQTRGPEPTRYLPRSLCNVWNTTSPLFWGPSFYLQQATRQKRKKEIRYGKGRYGGWPR